MPIVGGDGYDTPLLAELGGEARRISIFTTHQGIYDKTPVSEAFNAAYEAEYGNPPEAVFAALGYDGIKLMADAITRAGTIDGAAVRDALAATQGFEGVTGTISYEPGSPDPVEVGRADRGRRRQEQSPRDRRARGGSGGVGNLVFPSFGTPRDAKKPLSRRDGRGVWGEGRCRRSRPHCHCSTPAKTSFNASVSPGNTRDAIAPPSPPGTGSNLSPASARTVTVRASGSTIQYS